MRLELRRDVHVTDTQAEVTNMYAIEETFIWTYICSMDAKHPGHVNEYVLLIVKFAIFVISGPINFGFYSRMGFSA